MQPNSTTSISSKTPSTQPPKQTGQSTMVSPNHSSPIQLPSTSTCQVNPKTKRLDSPEKVSKYEEVLSYFKNEKLGLARRDSRILDPNNEEKKEDKVKMALTEDEKLYLSKECLIRVLIAEKWNVKAAVTRLEKHLVWRRTLNLYDLEACYDELAEEFKSGKLFTLGYSTSCEPILYMTPSLHNTEPSFKQVKDICFVVERGIDLMVSGVEEISFIVDLSGKISRSSQSISVMKKMLSTVQLNYFERLGFAEVKNLSWWGKLIVNMLWPFIDPYTRDKVGFDGNLQNGRVPGNMLLAKWGGDLNFEYNSEDFNRALLDICLERREEERVRWREAGGVVGISELDIKRKL